MLRADMAFAIGRERAKKLVKEENSSLLDTQDMKKELQKSTTEGTKQNNNSATQKLEEENALAFE